MDHITKLRLDTNKLLAEEFGQHLLDPTVMSNRIYLHGYTDGLFSQSVAQNWPNHQDTYDLGYADGQGDWQSSQENGIIE